MVHSENWRKNTIYYYWGGRHQKLTSLIVAIWDLNPGKVNVETTFIPGDYPSCTPS